MKKLLLAILLLVPFLSRAGHVGGIDLFYTHLTGNTYKVTMIVYGNCGDSEYPKLFTLNPQIDVIDSVLGGTFRTMELNLMTDSVTNASPYCQRYKDSTNCTKPSSLYQGYTRFVYTDTITLPRVSSKWIFRFNSAMKSGCANRLGRPALSNYVNPSSNNAVLDAMLNNTVTTNSSPTSKVSLFPAYCVNVPSVYDQLTTDPNGDSLVYEIVRPLYSSNCATINTLTSVANYNPLHTVAGTFNFDTRNGRLSFTGDLIQTSAVNVKIYEYRNGVLVGSVMRERIFKVLGTCNNQPPVAAIDTTAASLSGAIAINADTLFACPGSVVKFRIPVSNPFGDTVTASVEQVISGSNVIISKNNTTTPAIDFQWNTTGVANGTYTFYARFFTKSCPLPSTALTRYTIVIGGAGYVNPVMLTPTNCVRKAMVQFNLSDGRPPYQLTVLDGSNVVKSYTDTAHVITDSLAAGNYHIKLMSVGLPCLSETDFSVVDSGIYPYKPTVVSPVEFCRNADGKALVAYPDSVAQLRWYDPSGKEVQGAPTPPTSTSGTTYWTVSNVYKSCESVKDSIAVVVNQDECDYDLKVFNVITPNGDGKNDKWIFKNIQYYPNILVQVYDKLGDKVFERRGYQNDWDGGNLPTGMYYYLIRLNGINRTTGQDTYNGYLMIKR